MVDDLAHVHQQQSKVVLKFDKEKAAALVSFFSIYALLTFPVVIQPATYVIGRVFEDAFESIWYLHWYKHALFDLGVSPFYAPNVFYPVGWDLRFAVLPPVYPLLFAPLTWLTGPVAAYNIALLITVVWAAYGTYLLVRTLGGNWVGGVLAGITFAFAPQREVYLGGHLNTLLGSMWLPWIVYGVAQAAHIPQQRSRWVALAFAACALSICGAWQFALIGGTTLVLSVAIWWPGKLLRERRSWFKPLTLGLLIFLVISAPVIIGGLQARSGVGAGAEFSFQDVDSTSTSLERLFVPSGINPLFWDLARKTFPLTNGQDSVVALGYVSIILALYFVLKSPRSDRARAIGLALVLVGIILTLGTTLHFWGKPILLPLTESAAKQVRSVLESVDLSFLIDGQALQIPLPGLIPYWLLPFTRSFHHFGRWSVLTSLGVALLAGLGLTRLLHRHTYTRRRKAVVSVVLVVLLVVEFNMQPILALTTTQQMHRTVDDWLAAQPAGSALIEFPLSYSRKGQSLYYTIAHGQPIVHGYSIIPPAGVADMMRVLDQWPAPPALDLLQQIGAKYILADSFVNDDFETKQLPQLLSIPRLHLIQVFPTNVGTVRDIYLFEIQPEAP